MHTPFCDVVGVDVPIVLAPFGPWDEVELGAADSNAGALGSVGTAVRDAAELRGQWARLRELTDEPFVINHTGRPFNEDAFAASLDAAPAAISFDMGVPADLIARAHDRGILWLQTFADAEAADLALTAGADVLIAQGTEAGGHGGWIGTRFLATSEIDAAWKQRIVAADASDAVKVPNSERIMPPYNIPQGSARYAPRALRTPLIDQLETDPDGLDPATVGPQLVKAVREGGGHDLIPFTGQSAALVRDIVPAAELIAHLLDEAETAARHAASVVAA